MRFKYVVLLTLRRHTLGPDTRLLFQAVATLTPQADARMRLADIIMSSTTCAVLVSAAEVMGPVTVRSTVDVVAQLAMQSVHPSRGTNDVAW